MSALEIDSPEAPAPLTAILRSLQAGGHQAWWVGESLHASQRGEPPISFEVSTSLSPDQCLERHPNAVPTRLEEATVMIPSAAGPIDVSSFRNGDDVAADLARRDFSVHAMACDPIAGRLLDPYDGRADAAAKRLRAVRSASDRLREDPLRALRAARFCARYGYAPDQDLLDAMRKAASSLSQLRAIRIRWELSAMLRSRGAEVGVGWLQRAGLATALFPGAQDARARRLDQLPTDLALRLVWLLRGSRPVGALRRLGFGRITAARVQTLLAHHPIEDAVKPGSDHAVRRLLGRLTGEDLTALLQLRELELPDLEQEAAAIGTARLAALRATIARVRDAEQRAALRPVLALDGRAVMQSLGCGPGPRVGSALGFLASCVAEDPGCNTPDALQLKLREWERQQ